MVLTNRERYSLTHDAAVNFAKARGTVVIWWMMNWSHWAQKPDKEHIQEALLDPCFYEYWVYNGPGYIIDKISGRLQLVNVQGIQCHSLSLENPKDE